jgi:hypothetical protein
MGADTRRSDDVPVLATEALAIGDVVSAVIFTAGDGSSDPELAAAAGIEGAALVGLVAAVRDPRHPVRLAFADPGPTFDVAPINPGGPALRSHLPMRRGAGDSRAAGVLAVAHGLPTTESDRRRLTELADRIAARLS